MDLFLHSGDVTSQFKVLVTFKEAAVAAALHHRGVLYKPLLSLWKMSRRNWYISHSSLYLCAMFQVLWSGFMLTFTSALFSLASFLGPSENGSIGFQWGVFHLRQSSLPFPTRSPFDRGYLFWDPTFQLVVWSEICCGCFVHCSLKKTSCSSALVEEMSWCFCPLLVIFAQFCITSTNKADIEIVQQLKEHPLVKLTVKK